MPKPLTTRELREALAKFPDDYVPTFEGNDTYFYAGRESNGLVTLFPCPDEETEA